MKKKLLLLTFMVLMGAMASWAQTLTINQPNPQCTVTASPAAPAPGQTVTLTVDLNGEICALGFDDLVVTDVSNNNMQIPVTAVGGTPVPFLYYMDSPGSYTFTMPPGDVVVDVNIRNVFPVICQPDLNGSYKIDNLNGWNIPNSTFTNDQYVEAFEGMDVQLLSNPDPGYEFSSYYVVAQQPGHSMIVDKGERFQMPPCDVEVYPNFKPEGEFFVSIDPNIDQLVVQVQASPSCTPDPDDIVTLNITPQTPNCGVSGIIVSTLDDGGPIAPVFIQDGDFKFMMPGQDVAVYVNWIDLPDGSDPHEVNIANMNDGQVQIITPFDEAPNLNFPGNLVQLYPLPDPGFEIDQVFVNYSLPGITFTAEVLPNSSQEYWFKMPGCPVVVTASFKATTLTNVYTLYVDNDNPNGNMDIRINGSTLPHGVSGSFDVYYPVFKDDIISVTAYPNAGYGIREFHLEDLYVGLGNYSPSSNGTASFPMPAQDAYLYADFSPLVTLEVERGNPSVGTLEVVNINGATPPTPTVNANNNYEYQIFADDVVDVVCNPAQGYRVSDIKLEETGTQFPIQNYGAVPSASIQIPNIEGLTQMTLRAEYAPYLLTLAVDGTKVTVNSINGQTVTPASQNGDYDIYYVYENDKIDVTAITPTGYNFNQFEFNPFDATNPYIPYPGNAYAALDMPSYDVMLTAAFTPIDYRLSVVYNNNSYQTIPLDSSGSRWPRPDGFDSSYDYYRFNVGDEIGVKVLNTPNPNVFVEHYELKDAAAPNVVLATYAGPTVPKIVMPAQDVILEAFFFNSVFPWQSGAYSLKIDKNIPNGTLNMLTINGTAVPPHFPASDYDLYYPVYPGDQIRFDYTTALTLDDCTLYDTQIPANYIEDYSSWSWAPGTNFQIYSFTMPAQDALLTGAFRGDTLGITVKTMDLYGNTVSVLVNGQPAVPRWSFIDNGENYEEYLVLYDDEVKVIGHPIENFAVRAIIRQDDWNYAQGRYMSTWTDLPTEGPLYPSSLTAVTYRMPFLGYGYALVVVDFQPGYTLEVDHQTVANGQLTEVYRNGQLMPFVQNGAGNYEYYPIFENDVVVVRNVPNPGYINLQYDLNWGTTVPPDVVPTTGTFTMPGFNSFLTGQFALDTYNINIRSRRGRTYAHNSPPPFSTLTQITNAQVGATVYIEFDPFNGHVFDPNNFTVTYSGGADAQPTLLPTSGPPYTHASFVWLSAEDVDINVIYKSPNNLRGDVDGDGTVGITDVTALIDYILNGSASGVTSNSADCDLSGTVGITDVTALIDFILNGIWP